MATKFEALDELLDDALELPVPGRDKTVRTYRIPSPSAEDGLRIQRITMFAAKLMGDGEDPDTEVLDDDQERDIIADALGPAQAEMVTDGVDWAWLRHSGLTAVIWVSQGPEAAAIWWRAAGDPTQMVVPNRADRRAAAKSGSATAAKTPRRASTSGSNGRRAGKTAPKASQV